MSAVAIPLACMILLNGYTEDRPVAVRTDEILFLKQKSNEDVNGKVTASTEIYFRNKDEVLEVDEDVETIRKAIHWCP